MTVIEQVQRAIPEQWQPRLLPAYREVRRRARRVARSLDRRTLSRAGLRCLLVDLGFTPGANVMVHSSMDEIGRRVPGMTPTALIDLLQELVTPAGTVLMPTFPFLGPQRTYVEKRRIFDVARTPAQVGLVTEVFRRLPGVVRSQHPTHSIAAWGKHAHELTRDHHRGTAFGESSPIYKLRHVGGRVVGLGTGLKDSFTILHLPEELAPKLRELCFEDEPVTMTIVNGSERTEYPLVPLKPGLHRRYARVERTLTRDGVLRHLTRGGLRCAVVDVDAFLTRALELVEADAYLF